MSPPADLERARRLAKEAIAECDALGLSLAAAHLQLGLDMLDSGGANRVRELPLPWQSGDQDLPERS